MPSKVRKIFTKVTRTIMKSQKLRVLKQDMPIRLRPWLLVFTCVIIALLAFLGFTNFPRALPLNDKILHFLSFCIASGAFYFIFDADEDARRIWFWRYSGLFLTIFFCMFCGGILIEIVQAALPYKEFEWGDVAANLLGSTLGIWVAFNLERYYRHRRELQLLPTHHKNKGKIRLTDVWDEREELFGIGDESDEEGGQEESLSLSKIQAPRIVISHS